MPNKKQYKKQKELETLSEEKGNVVAVCRDCVKKLRHSEEVVHDYKKGDFIKLPFTAESGVIEHMWVEIKNIKFDPILHTDVILGVLANNPLHCNHLKYGDKIILDKAHKSEIEDVYYK